MNILEWVTFLKQDLVLHMFSSIYKKNIVILFILIGGVYSCIFFTACSDTKAIYAEIEKEELIKTSNLSNVITAQGMIRFGDKYYVASGGALHTRFVSGENWSRATLPSGFDGISQIVSVNDSTAYAILIRDFYKEISATALAKLTAKGSSIKFDIKQTVSFNDKQIAKIFVVKGEDNVYASVLQSPYTNSSKYSYYKNYQKSSPKLLTINNENAENQNAENQNDTITAVTKFKNIIYVSTQSQIFTLAGSGNLSPVKKINTKISGYIDSIYSTEKFLYIANHEYLWRTNDGKDWNSALYSKRMFTYFIEIKSSQFNGVLVGTRYLPSGFLTDNAKDEGYYELDKGDINSLRKPSGNKYTSGMLDEAGIVGFFVDEKTNNLFVFTYTQGLWRGNYEASRNRNIDWFQE